MAESHLTAYRLSPAAQHDLDDIFDYTMVRWGLAHAVAYTQSIERACATLAKAPTSGRDCAAIRAGYRGGLVKRHVIYFRVEDYGIAVIRILHQRMDAPRHL